MGVETVGFQSGIVLAVVIAAVLFGDRFGGAPPLSLRVAQVALGLVLMMLVLSATTSFHGPLGARFDVSDEEAVEAVAEFARRSSVLGTIHIGVAIIFLVGGLVLSRKGCAVAAALLLAGVLLLLIGVPTGWPAGYVDPVYRLINALLPGGSGDAGDARNIARIAVLLVGAVVLGVTICLQTRGDAGDDAAQATDS